MGRRLVGERLTQNGVVAYPRDSDSARVRSEQGFTLVELVVVMVIIAILVSIAAVFHYGARERSSDAAARSNIRTAVPAIEAYRSETGGYGGMTLAGLKSTYSPGIGDIVVEWSTDEDYCVSNTLNGRTWWKQGPAGQITMTSC
jgi:prepilin-type N-terminal cleavage/methylation domain-containing protein